MIGIWLVNTTNSILLTSETAMVKTIIPYLVFQAHGTPITNLQFAPLQNCRYLVSSGFDKTLKFFDLMDTCKLLYIYLVIRVIYLVLK